MKKPNPHLFNEGGGLVTRCQDVRVARRLLVKKWLDEEVGLDFDDPEQVAQCREDIALASARFRPHHAHVGHGRIVPADPYEPDVTWWWRAGDGHLGQRGVTPAVWWDPK